MDLPEFFSCGGGIIGWRWRNCNAPGWFAGAMASHADEICLERLALDLLRHQKPS
jgi:hypothetical protein